jgi:hypothetical protein
VDAVVYFALALMMVIMFPWRLYQVWHSEPNAVAVMPGLKVVLLCFVLVSRRLSHPSFQPRLFFCTLLSLISVASLLGQYISSTLLTYEMVRLVVLSSCWVAVAVVVVLEDNKNLASNFTMQLWCVAAFTADAIRLQSVISLWITFDWTVSNGCWYQDLFCSV